MKAIVCTKYGPPEVLELQEVEKPVPKYNEVLIKIHAATVTLGDCELRSLQFAPLLKFLMRMAMGFRGPRKRSSILGQELAGEIEAIGKDVKRFKVGDQVFATTGFHFGAYAEYVCLPADSGEAVVVLKPENISYEEAAAIPVGGMEALHFIRKAKILEGQTILIRGASGSIGTFAIQLAKYFGAVVTGVGNPDSLEMMKSIGADKVIDYTSVDFTKNDETYDIIFDIVGKSSVSNYIGSLKKGGIYLLANPKLALINREKRVAKGSGIKYVSGNLDNRIIRAEQLNFLKELIEVGKLKSVIGKTYALEDMVEAHKFVEEGYKVGNVVIKVI